MGAVILFKHVLHGNSSVNVNAFVFQCKHVKIRLFDDRKVFTQSKSLLETHTANKSKPYE